MTASEGSMIDLTSEMTLRLPVRIGTIEDARNGLFIPRVGAPGNGGEPGVEACWVDRVVYLATTVSTG